MCYAEHHLKRMLAFSTICRTGIMLLAIGLGGPLAFAAMMVYLVVHAFTRHRRRSSSRCKRSIHAEKCDVSTGLHRRAATVVHQSGEAFESSAHHWVGNRRRS
jgi:NADH:ubiquinone oxidoreductase subunit 2 (subunit N)